MNGDIPDRFSNNPDISENKASSGNFVSADNMPAISSEKRSDFSGGTKTGTKQKLPYSLIASLLVISVIAGAASGAVSSYSVIKLMSSDIQDENTTEQQEAKTKKYIDSANMQAGISFQEGTDEDGDTEPIEQSSDKEDNTFMPSQFTEPSETPAETPSALSKGDIYKKAVNSIYAVKSEYTKVYSTIFGQSKKPVTCTGTGFAVNKSGYIITNFHVIENGKKITVTDYNGKNYPAKLVGAEPNNDIAVLKIDAKTTAVSLGSSSELAVGDDIMIIGNALGELSYTFTNGIISHLSRDVLLESGKTINMFQTNAAINSGNSGGPVYNTEGEVIGIASAKYASEDIEGLGFCIPIDDVRGMINDIILYGYVRGKPALGVSIQTVTQSMSLRYNIPIGCYIVALGEASAAENAGLCKGDVILKINGSKTLKYESVEKLLGKLSAGDKVEIEYSRNGSISSVKLTLDEYRPAAPRTSYTNVHDF